MPQGIVLLLFSAAPQTKSSLQPPTRSVISQAIMPATLSRARTLMPSGVFNVNITHPFGFFVSVLNGLIQTILTFVFILFWLLLFWFIINQYLHFFFYFINSTSFEGSSPFLISFNGLGPFVISFFL